MLDQAFDKSRLVAVYEKAKAIGLLGPGPVSAHIDHAQAFLGPVANSDGPILDLGSGAGVPGLFIAMVVDRPVTLLDTMAKRCAFLRDAASELGLGNVRVLEGRAEALARTEERGSYEVVTARSFASPAVTAECAVGFLIPNGLLAVSEPPTEEVRWPADGLKQLGLELLSSAEDRVAVLRLRAAGVDDRFPRRVGVPEKRPIF